MSTQAMMPLSDYADICNEVRSKTGCEEPIKSGNLADKIVEVYTKGYEEGYNEGHTTGVAEGKQAQYDLFWNAFQLFGARKNYSSAFYYWKDDSALFPKYNIENIRGCDAMFRDAGNDTSLLDLTERFNNCGIILDTSSSIDANYMFYGTRFSRVPELNLSSAGKLIKVFSYSYISTIDKIILSSDGSQEFDRIFDNATLLKNVTFEGVIGQNGLSFETCPLISHDSIMSAIDSLKDYSGTTTTKTITLGTRNLKKLTDSEKAIATERGWTLV